MSRKPISGNYIEVLFTVLVEGVERVAELDGVIRLDSIVRCRPWNSLPCKVWLIRGELLAWTGARTTRGRIGNAVVAYDSDPAMPGHAHFRSEWRGPDATQIRYGVQTDLAAC